MLYVLRTGCQWKMLPREYYAGSTTHKYFQKWVQAGVFLKMWKMCLREYDDLKGVEWRWQVLDSQTVSAPVKGEKNREKPYGSGKNGDEAAYHRRREWDSAGGGADGSERARFKGAQRGVEFDYHRSTGFGRADPACLRG
jgi:transposase